MFDKCIENIAFLAQVTLLSPCINVSVFMSPKYVRRSPLSKVVKARAHADTHGREIGVRQHWLCIRRHARANFEF